MLNTFICKQCGKEYTKNKENSSFCCKQCQIDYAKSQRIPYNCDYCGKEILLVKSRYMNLLNGKQKHMYCSDECRDKARIKYTIVNCKNCGKETKRFAYIKSHNDFCCYDCFIEYTRKNSLNQERICPICGKSFKTNHIPQIYCSYKCMGVAKQKRSNCKCDNCGKEFERAISSFKDRKNHFCSKQCADEYFGWDKNDLDILEEYYGNIPTIEIQSKLSKYYSYNAIKRQALKMNLGSNPFWTNEEDEILKNNYSYISLDALLKLLPNRTKYAIVDRAVSLGIKSYHFLKSRYTKEDEQYIKDNYLKLSNKELGAHLGRQAESIQKRLVILGLVRPYCLANINIYVRRRIEDWKNKYRESCNYTCALSGKRSNIVVHHIRSFNLLIKETIDVLDFQLKDDPNEYTQEELTEFVEVFMNIQNYYNAYVCITEDIHKLFHKEYGYGDNTEKQWEEFVTNYHNGKYNKIA